jgi:putative transcriptional regulator
MRAQEIKPQDLGMGLVRFRATSEGPSASGHLEVKLSQLLKDRNLSMLALSRASGSNYESLRSLASGRAKLISFNVLERVCVSLKCEVSDILKMTRSEPEIEKEP